MRSEWECSAVRRLLEESERALTVVDEEVMRRGWEGLKRIMANPPSDHSHALDPESAVCRRSGPRWKRQVWRGPTVRYCPG